MIVYKICLSGLGNLGSHWHFNLQIVVGSIF